MRALRFLRNQHIKAATQLNAKPNIREVFASQSNQISPADMLARDFLPIAPVQAPDGTPFFMFGYSRLGDGDVVA